MIMRKNSQRLGVFKGSFLRSLVREGHSFFILYFEKIWETLTKVKKTWKNLKIENK